MNTQHLESQRSIPGILLILDKTAPLDLYLTSGANVRSREPYLYRCEGLDGGWACS